VVSSRGLRWYGNVPSDVSVAWDGTTRRGQRLQKGRSNIEGFKFTALSKQQLMEGLAGAIHRREITYPDGPIVHELEAFQYEYSPSGVRYAASAGMHDDCVCALALAVRLFAQPPRRAIWPSTPQLSLTRPLRRGLAA
jgi:hypothetical protein